MSLSTSGETRELTDSYRAAWKEAHGDKALPKLGLGRFIVVADTDAPTPPCGACRQILWEFCGDVDVILANLTAIKDRRRLAELLPLPFNGRLLS